MATSLLIGVLMLSVPTFAEMNMKSGYDKFKDSIKSTAEVLSSGADNYQAEVAITLKDNDKVFLKTSNMTKVDNKNGAQESSETTVTGEFKKQTYHYRDSKQIISKEDDKDYIVTEYATPQNEKITSKNPFEEENAADIEKIIDAAVAGLKDNVIAEDKSDGSKTFSGTITDNQVPAIINTISSYMFKTEISRGMRNSAIMPELTNDIYIKNVSGHADADKDGILKNLLATVELSGKEKNGTNHDITFEILMDVSNTNKTVVNPPDLTGKNVQKRTVKNSTSFVDPGLFIGEFKNDIVILDNGKYVKIGERVLTIAHADEKTVEGRYHEEYTGNYKNTYKAVDFTFAAENPDKQGKKGSGHYVITKDGKAETGSIFLEGYSGNINFYSESVQSSQYDSYDGNYMRNFDK